MAPPNDELTDILTGVGARKLFSRFFCKGGMYPPSIPPLFVEKMGIFKEMGIFWSKNTVYSPFLALFVAGGNPANSFCRAPQ